MKRTLLVFLSLFILWCLLNWVPDWQHLASGIFVAAFVTYMTRDLFSGGSRLSQWPVKALFFFQYLVMFLWEMIKANAEMALRIVRPELCIKPGILRVRVSLKSNLALTFLANTMTLTSGTMFVDLDKVNGVFYLHCIDAQSESPKKTMAKFEKILGKIFE